jgi:hypothetical protein
MIEVLADRDADGEAEPVAPALEPALGRVGGGDVAALLAAVLLLLGKPPTESIVV